MPSFEDESFEERLDENQRSSIASAASSCTAGLVSSLMLRIG